MEADTREEYLLAVIISWINCRCLSFCMVQCSLAAEKHSKGIDHKDGVLYLLAYCLYFPLLFSGPLVMYDDFQRDVSCRVLEYLFVHDFYTNIMSVCSCCHLLSICLIGGSFLSHSTCVVMRFGSSFIISFYITRTFLLCITSLTS